MMSNLRPRSLEAMPADAVIEFLSRRLGGHELVEML
jgi:hypothetical protein